MERNTIGMKTYYVYLLTSPSGTLYVGMTNDLVGRAYEHKRGVVPRFTSRYGVDRLVCFEGTGDARSAIAREKQLKGWRRARKIELIESANPRWEDLSDGWYS